MPSRVVEPRINFSENQAEDALKRDYNVSWTSFYIYSHFLMSLCRWPKVVTQTEDQRIMLDDVEARKKEILELEHSIQVGSI